MFFWGSANSDSTVQNDTSNLYKRPAKNKRLKKSKPKDAKDSSDANPVASSSAVMDVFQGGTVTCIKCLSCEKVNPFVFRN